MGKVKKGLLFTLSMLLLGSSFLFLSASLSAYSFSLKNNAQVINNFEKINSQFDGASYGMGEIFEHEALTITQVGNNVHFEEEISGFGKQNYTRDVMQFKQFIQSYGRVNVSIDDAEAGNPKMYLMPQNISIDHRPGSIIFSPQNYSGSEESVEGYDILIKINHPTPTINWTNASEVSGSNESALYFHIGLQGSDGAVSDTVYLDRYAESELRLLNSESQSIVTVQIESPATLTLNYNVDMYLNAVVVLNNSIEYIELGQDAVEVEMGPDGTKRGAVIVFES